MKTRTLCFAPGRVTPGVTLAKAAVNRDGHILLSAETVLDSEMLDRLIQRGVESISVCVPDARDEETIANEMIAAQARVEHIFRSKENNTMEALYRAILTYRLESTR